ncbi:MAG: hypothetical protein JHC33_07970 [Ignisphaera sp.]|nr:hypothetical protein [Ignisphaera sp.]
MSNTPAQTTDSLYHSVGTANSTIGFYGATGSAGPVGVTGATAGGDPALIALQNALVTLGLIKKL